MTILLTLIHTIIVPFVHSPLFHALRGLIVIGLLATLAAMFKPLLMGIGQAAMLFFKPALSKEQRIARRHMRDAALLRKMLNNIDGSAPSHAAELQAIAARA